MVEQGLGKEPGTEREKILIVTADDFGASAHINEAVRDAHRFGLVTGASLMVTGAAAGQAVAIAGAYPQLAVGLHVSLLQAKSVLPAREIPHLVDARGAFREDPVGAGLVYFFSRAVVRELAREIEAQIVSFLETGLTPAYLDGHHHLHMHPRVVGVVAELAARYHVPAVRWVNEPFSVHHRINPSRAGSRWILATTYRLLAVAARKRFESAGLRFPHRFFGLLQSGHLDEVYLASLIDRLPAGISEVGTHPAHGLPPELRRWAPAYGYSSELKALTSERLRRRLARRRVRLASYRIFAGPECQGMPGIPPDPWTVSMSPIS